MLIPRAVCDHCHCEAPTLYNLSIAKEAYMPGYCSIECLIGAAWAIKESRPKLSKSKQEEPDASESE